MKINKSGSAENMILAILQARFSSSRLPGKVLMPILGKEMLIHQVERIQHSKLIDKLVVATSVDGSDNEIEKVCENNGVEVFRGNLNNVLDRFYQCAKKYNPTHIVRLTGDCPLTDWEVIDNMIEYYLNEKLDYISSAKKIKEFKPRIACFVVYGQQPSASSQNMEGAVATSEELKRLDPEIKVLFVGGHVSALPRETLLTEKSIDIIALNEGVYSISNLLNVENLNDEKYLKKVKGIGFRNDDKQVIINESEIIVPKRPRFT